MRLRTTNVSGGAPGFVATGPGPGLAGLPTPRSASMNCAAHPRIGVSQLARRSGLPKTTTARLAADLVRHGFLDRTDSGAFKLGNRLFRLGSLASRERELREVALPYMADLRQVSRHTVHLAVLTGTDVVYVEIVRSTGGPRMPSEVGGRLPAHAAAVGKAMLAFSPPEVLDAVLARGLPAVGPPDDHRPRAARARAARIRDSGIAYENEESAHGVGCAASPVLFESRQPIGAISVSGWSGTLDLRRVGPAVRTAALAVGRELTRRGDATP